VAEELPGFWVRLKMQSDEASFAKGIQNLSGVANALKAIGTAIIAGKIAQEITKLAEATAKSNLTAFFAAMDPTQLQLWSLVMARAGQDAVSFTSALTDLNTQFVRLTTEGDKLPDKTAKALGLLGLDVTKEMGRSGQQRGEDILNAAQAYSAALGNTAASQQSAAQLVNDLLGQAGSNYYVWMEKSKTSLAEQMKLAGGLNYQTPGATTGVMGAVADLNSLKATWQSIKAELSSRIMIAADPAFKELMKYLVDNKDAIIGAITSIAQVSGELATAFTAMVELLGGKDSKTVIDKADAAIYKINPDLKKYNDAFKRDPALVRFMEPWPGFWAGKGPNDWRKDEIVVKLAPGAERLIDIGFAGASLSTLKRGSKMAQAR
jgi:hypothetical protein